MIFQRTMLAASLMVAMLTAQAATPTNEEIWEKLQQIQEQLSDIKQQNKLLKAENEGLKYQIMSAKNLAEEANETAEAVADATEEVVKTASLSASKTTIGGFGELFYSNLDDQNGSSDKDEIDFHHFVLFFDHEFNDNLRFYSELELEHALTGEGNHGVLGIEQAYIEYDINEQHHVKGGLFVIPVGTLNETHEPNTFYGTERNPVERDIIPTTWWEAGVMFSGEIGNGFSYDLAATSGLDVYVSEDEHGSEDDDSEDEHDSEDDTMSYNIRDGRQKVSEALADDFAYTGRLKWTGIPGVELAATVQYQEDVTQSQDETAGSGILFETHAVIQRGNYGLRALYAMWNLNGDGPKASGYDEQTGWYIEPSYRINDNFGIFARYNEWDNQAGSSSDTEYKQFDIGVNWWPHRDVVVKVDYQNQSAPGDERELDGVNVGLGYQF